MGVSIEERPFTRLMYEARLELMERINLRRHLHGVRCGCARVKQHWFHWTKHGLMAARVAVTRWHKWLLHTLELNA